MISEKLLQFIWRLQYFNAKDLKTVGGNAIQLLYRGDYNTNQGPDFLNAKIKIDDVVFAGSVELHVTSKDWHLHKHDGDANYANVVLHVVWQHNTPGETLANYPVLALQPYVSGVMLQHYADIMHSGHSIACANSIHLLSALTINNWKDRLLLERLQQKTDAILQLHAKNNGSWEETFWQKLARNFGVKVNGEAFEEMAIHTPTAILAKNKLSQIRIEALLLGQAGLLADNSSDDYALMLQKEYKFLLQKYPIQPSPIKAQFLRMRPFAFPTIRLSQLAALIFSSSKLFSKVLECKNYKDVMQLFNTKANDYWHYHYKLGDEPSVYKEKWLGEEFLQNIVINTIAPTLFAYGLFKNDEQYKQRAVLWLESIPAEVNSITKDFRQIEVKSKTAADSQALIQLKNNYCVAKKCLDCAIGATILHKAK